MNEERASIFHVVTVVWGKPYVDVFLNVAIPNQLTAGNLGALPAGSRYRVFTSPEDTDALTASPALGRVKDLMPVDLVVMPELSDGSIPELTGQRAGHCRALVAARDAKAALVFLCADHFLSEGALAAVVRRHATGWRAVASVGIRLDKVGFIAALTTRGGAYSVGSRELVALALDNLHPFSLAHVVDAQHTARQPISIYWNIPGEGILARAFFLHPLMVDPVVRDALPRRGCTIDANYLEDACPRPEQTHVVTDSDELCLFELSNVNDAVPDVVSGAMPLWRVAATLGGCNRHHQAYWAETIRLHARDIDGAWDSVERQSTRFAKRAWRLCVAVSWLRPSFRRVKEYRRRAGEARKAVRRGRQLLQRARRSAGIVMHSVARSMTKVRKRTVKASRRVLRRAHAAH